MKSIEAFVIACKPLTSAEIYELYEGADEYLRYSIIAYGADFDAVEPVREALNYIGLVYSVQSLVDY